MTQHCVRDIQFQFYEAKELKKICACKVSESSALDQDNVPVKNGVYDLRMGPIDEFSNCETCGLRFRECPGHLGRYRFFKPLLNPLSIPELISFLNITCVYCGHVCVKNQIQRLFGFLRTTVICGFLERYKEFSDIYLDFISKLDVLKEKFIVNIDDIEKKLLEEVKKASEEAGYESYIEYFTDMEAAYSYNGHLRNMEKELVQSYKKALRGLKKCNRCENTRWKFSHDHRSIRIRISQKEYKKLINPPKKKGKKKKKKKKKKEVDDKDEEEESDDDVEMEDRISTFRTAFAVLNERILHKSKYEPNIPLLSEHVFKFCKKVWDNDTRLLQELFNGSIQKPHSMFFMKYLPIPSNRFREPAIVPDSQKLKRKKQKKALGEKELQPDDLTRLLMNIIKSDTILKDYVRNHPYDHENNTLENFCEYYYGEKYLSMTRNVQLYVNCLGGTETLQQVSYKGVKNSIDKKGGIFRENTMGKRVNYSARSVLLPDPYLRSSQVSIPVSFAKKLTFPERVCYTNVNKLRKLVMNGPNVYPGANYVQDERGYQTDLSHSTDRERQSIANRLLKDKYTIVRRHLLDGDVGLMNRQPSLHRPSILGKVVRVFRNESSLRIHPANCKSFNADFDGDEMNFHCVQNILGASEIRNILMAYKQFNSPTSGHPIRGLIQDFIVSSVLLTKKDCFLTRGQYMQLVYTGLHTMDSFKPVPPAILKPQVLWTGKQVISTLLLNLFPNNGSITHSSNAAVKPVLWGEHKGESNVVIINGELVTGVIDKNQIGAKKKSLLSTIHSVCGAAAVDSFISALVRVNLEFLQFEGFSCGFEDGVLKNKFERKRQKYLGKAVKKTKKKVVSFLDDKEKRSLEEYLNSVKFDQSKLDHHCKSVLSKFHSRLMEEVIFNKGLLREFPSNNLLLMTETGAKGGTVNISQISCCLAQQLFEGRRVEYSKVGQTLPSYLPFDSDPAALGFVAERFISGIGAQEFFFHCVAGREGLIDTAIKTSKSGYLQRSLVKGLELLSVEYDNTVRDSFGAVIQFEYGTDGIDVEKVDTLEQLDVLMNNFQHYKDNYLDESVFDEENDDENIDLSERFDLLVKDFVDDTYRELEKRGIDSEDFESVFRIMKSSCAVDPGSAVGITAAQSIGEPSTQMTLNTFHVAGVEESHVTQGIPLLRSILWSGTCSTPFLKVPVSDDVDESDLKIISMRLGNLTFKQVISGVKIVEGNKGAGETHLGSVIQKVEIKYDCKLLREHYLMKDEDVKEFLDDFVYWLIISLKSNGKSIKRNYVAQKEMVKTALENTLDLIWSDRVDENMMDLSEDGESPSEEDGEKETEPEKRDPKPSKTKNVDYSVDLKRGLIKITVGFSANSRVDTHFTIMNVASNVQFRSVDGISSFRFSLNSNKDKFLTTNGVNFNVLWLLSDFVNLDEIETNDIRAFVENYGIEAGRNLCEEILQNTFKNHGIDVNFRHINLICDYMFCQGKYLPFNRRSKKFVPGVLNKASFETCTRVITNSCVRNVQERVQDCSAQISVGQLTSQGTGSFDVMIDFQRLLKNNNLIL